MATNIEDGDAGSDDISAIGSLDSGLPTVLGQDGTTTYGGDMAFEVDDIRFYNYVLTPEEVDALVEASGRTFCTGEFDAIAGDLNGDCIVDLQDFAAIAASWLECTQTPASACP